jgi:hypothetical protein
MERIAPGATSVGNKLVAGNLPENGSYLGVPLLLLVVIVAVRFRRDHWVRLVGALTLATFVLSLGPILVVDGHTTGIPLPFDLIQHLPFLNNILTVRFSLYVCFFSAILLALGIDRSPSRARRISDHAALELHSHKLAHTLSLGAIGLLVVAAVISLLPRWPYSGTTAASVPAYFTTTAVNRIPPDSIVLISPYPSVEEVQPELYQAFSQMRFKIIGGYGIFTTPTGAASPFAACLRPYDIEVYLWTEATGSSPPASCTAGRTPTDRSRLIDDARVFLRKYHVGTVLVTTPSFDPQAVDALFVQALGPPSSVKDGVTAWYSVQQHLKHLGFGAHDKASTHTS